VCLVMITSFKNRIRLLIVYIYMHLLTNNHVSWRTKSVPPAIPTDPLTCNETSNLWCQAMAILLNTQGDWACRSAFPMLS
jgi:hypothetical protein